MTAPIRKAFADLKRETRKHAKAREAFSRRLGAQLRREREAAGITLRECARRMTCSPAYLSDLERGRRSLTPDLVARIGKAIRA